jgi:acyl-CoA dehydrogenase
VDFALSQKVVELQERLSTFMNDYVYPAEPIYEREMAAAGDPLFHPPIVEDLKSEAKSLGLWNLFFTDSRYGAGLSNLEYAPLAEISGRSALGPEAINCAAPDTGNMEILAAFGTAEQREQWLQPLLEGTIRSCFAMTEPDVASSDARNIRAEIRREGDEYVINGRKWWTSGMGSPRCRFAIFMGKTDPQADPYHQQSMVIVPLDTAGVERVRSLPVFGYWHGRGGHSEAVYNDVRVPAENLLGQEGGAFAMAQVRLGPGRVHHCMRTIGVAERALELMCQRVLQRSPFGKPLSEQGVIQEWIAESRIEIEQARLLVLKTAWLMDESGDKSARVEISAIKASVPSVALRVLDRAIQAHGAAGVSDDFPLARMYAQVRTLRLADGPDEVHKVAIARRELRRWSAETAKPAAGGSAIDKS